MDHYENEELTGVPVPSEEPAAEQPRVNFERYSPEPAEPVISESAPAPVEKTAPAPEQPHVNFERYSPAPAEPVISEPAPAPVEKPAAAPEQPRVNFVLYSEAGQQPVVMQLVAEPEEETPPAVEASSKNREKKKGRGFLWAAIIVLLVALLLQPLALITFLGDGSSASSDAKSVVGGSINTRGELVLHYSDGTQQILGTVVGKDGADGSNGSDGSTTIIGGGDSAATVAISNALRSAVSVSCAFYQSGYRGSSSAYGSAGSGVIYQLDKEKGDALIVTNYHVVYDADSRQSNGIAEEIMVYLYGGEYADLGIEATYVGGSMYYDIAVLYIRDSELLRNSDVVAVTVADSDKVQVGSTAIAIGNAEGSGIAVTSGVVSVDSEHITMTASDGATEVDYRVIRVDTAVNSGNSGGGLFDETGKLIGIVNAKTIDDGVENIGYALPSSVVVAVTDNIIDYCMNATCESVMRPILGVTVTINDSRAVYDSETGMLSIEETVTVYTVEKGQLGSVFQEGDVLVSVKIGDREKIITRQHHLIDFMVTARVGDKVEFVVLRDGVETTLTVTITESCLTKY